MRARSSGTLAVLTILLALLPGTGRAVLPRADWVPDSWGVPPFVSAATTGRKYAVIDLTRRIVPDPTVPVRVHVQPSADDHAEQQHRHDAGYGRRIPREHPAGPDGDPDHRFGLDQTDPRRARQCRRGEASVLRVRGNDRSRKDPAREFRR